MKKLFIILIALIGCLTISLVGCNQTTDNGGNTESNIDSGNNQENSDPTPAPAENDILIVYFSYSGNTERVANEIISQSGGDGAEIIPAIPYTAADVNYNNSGSRSQVERRNDARPEISENTYGHIDMTEYETVIIGYPIWNGYEPMIIRTFIEHFNGLEGKTVHTFSTSASSGGSTAHNSVKGRVKATVGSNLHLTSSTLSNAATRVREWLNGLNLLAE